MKYIMLCSVLALSACVQVYDAELYDHLEAERDFHAYHNHMEHQYIPYVYDQEYVDDCLYYTNLVCEFE